MIVQVNSRGQFTIPKAARDLLKIERGDHLALDVQDGMMILMRLPANYADALAGLHHELWAQIDSDAYLRHERRSWEKAEDDSDLS